MNQIIQKGYLGIIEGFYGKPWGFATRTALIPFMKEYGYSFYLYAPKADSYLRENWHEPIPDVLMDKLSSMGREFHSAGISWGVGFSPFELHMQFDEKQKRALAKKVKQLASLGCDWLAILFDDMSGELDDLASRQIAIADFIRAEGGFSKYLVCPSYYSFDPVLEKVFGAMPQNYLQDLGVGLHPDYEIFWTGEKVCSDDYTLEHLESVQKLLQRKPFLWDNYPVNDGAGMSPYLHLKAVQGRSNCTPDYLSGLAVNPMNEAFLSTLPMATLSDCLRQGKQYVASSSLEKAAQYLLPGVGEVLLEDIDLFQEQGLKQLGDGQIATLRDKYSALRNEQNGPYIDEILAYLRGEYLFDIKENSVPTQALLD